MLPFLALIAFAGNSVLCRLALANDAIDPASFTGVRLISGALTLLVLLSLSNSGQEKSAKRIGTQADNLSAGSWFATLMLFVYAALFSFAYITLETGAGALILFGAVQVTMLLINFLRGNRLHVLEWLGLLLACIGFVYLVLPELGQPSLLGFLMMALAGIAWGAYTLEGQSAKDPLRATAHNFARCIPLAVVLLFVFFSQSQLNSYGLILAIASGAITSGLGYTIWYAALPKLTTTQAAVIQLLVPVIAAIGGVIFANELISLRLIIAAACILGGIVLVILARKRV